MSSEQSGLENRRIHFLCHDVCVSFCLGDPGMPERHLGHAEIPRLAEDACPEVVSKSMEPESAAKAYPFHETPESGR